MRQPLEYLDKLQILQKYFKKTLDILQYCNIIADINLGEVS